MNGLDLNELKSHTIKRVPAISYLVMKYVQVMIFVQGKPYILRQAVTKRRDHLCELDDLSPLLPATRISRWKRNVSEVQVVHWCYLGHG